MEQVLLQQHVRLLALSDRYLTPTGRKLIELLTFVLAISSLSILITLHRSYISNAHNNCLRETFNNNPYSFDEYDLIHVSVVNSHSHFMDLIYSIEDEQLNRECQIIRKDSRNFNNTRNSKKCFLHNNDLILSEYLFSLERGLLLLPSNKKIYYNVTTLKITLPSESECFGKSFSSLLLNYLIGYDVVILNSAINVFGGKGFMYKLASKELFNLNFAGDFFSKKGISMKNIEKSKSSNYGEQKLLRKIKNWVFNKEYDRNTFFGVLKSWFFSYLEFSLPIILMPLKPIMYYIKTKIINIDELEYFLFSADNELNENSNILSIFTNSIESYIAELEKSLTLEQSGSLSVGIHFWNSLIGFMGWFLQYLSFRIGVLFSTTFIFFISTTLVSYILRQTQDRMLRFTYLLHHHITHNIPFFFLVTTHVIDTLAFVPVLIGMYFCLFEFYNDQLLAFLVMLMVWMAEVFSVLSLRSRTNIRYFPRIFGLYFYLFHIYFFSFPFGFSYSALSTATLFVLHSMMHLWNNYEVAAFYRGLITTQEPRIGFPINGNLNNRVENRTNNRRNTRDNNNEIINNNTATTNTDNINTTNNNRQLRVQNPSNTENNSNNDVLTGTILNLPRNTISSPSTSTVSSPSSPARIPVSGEPRTTPLELIQDTSDTDSSITDMDPHPLTTVLSDPTSSSRLPLQLGQQRFNRAQRSLIESESSENSVDVENSVKSAQSERMSAARPNIYESVDARRLRLSRKAAADAIKLLNELPINYTRKSYLRGDSATLPEFSSNFIKSTKNGGTRNCVSLPSSPPIGSPTVEDDFKNYKVLNKIGDKRLNFPLLDGVNENDQSGDFEKQYEGESWFLGENERLKSNTENLDTVDNDGIYIKQERNEETKEAKPSSGKSSQKWSDSVRNIVSAFSYRLSNSINSQKQDFLEKKPTFPSPNSSFEVPENKKISEVVGTADDGQFRDENQNSSTCTLNDSSDNVYGYDSAHFTIFGRFDDDD